MMVQNPNSQCRHSSWDPIIRSLLGYLDPVGLGSWVLRSLRSFRPFWAEGLLCCLSPSTRCAAMGLSTGQKAT